MPKSRQTPSATSRSPTPKRPARDQSAGARPLSRAENAQLVQELKLHQLELELQITALAESRAQTEAALRMYTDLYDSAPVGYVTLSRDGSIQRANLAAAALLGSPPAALRGQRLGLFVSPETRAEFSAFHEALLVSQLKQSCEVVLEKTFQPSLIVSLEGVLTADQTECRVVVVDLTERRQEEAERTRLAAIVEFANDAIMSISRSGVIRSWNPGSERLFGYSAQEIIGRNVRCLIPSEHWEKESLVIQSVSRGAHIEHYETRRLHRDGTPVQVELTVSPIKDASGAITGVSSIALDITQRRKLQDQLRLLETSVAHLRDMVLITAVGADEAADPRIVFVNTAFEHKTGYTKAEAIGQTVNIMWGPKTSPECLAQIRSAVSSRQPARVEIINYTKHGEEFWSELDIVPIMNAAGQLTYCLAIHRDVTERRALEDQLRQAQKMEAIGQLAGGVAHDFNNLLLAMMLNLDLLRETLPRSTPDSPLHNLDLLTKRAKTLTSQLLIFARQQHVQLQPLELNAALNNVLAMMRRVLGEPIELHVELATSALWVEADLGLLDLAVMNLCLNARDAMPGGGRMTVTTSLVEIDGTSPPAHADSQPGIFVCLQVTDIGCGMSADILQHLFEPFFTTKEPGKGTGLGLASVYGIVRQHHGWVNVESNPGTGTTFRVYLPYLVGAHSAPPPPPQAEPKRGGTETILLVEDEEMVRKLTTKILQRLGYRVLAAETASQALRVWQQHEHDIALLLTDMVMPEGTTGLQLAEKLRQTKTSLKIVLMSGYSAEIVHSALPSEGIDAFITKPFDLTTLAATLRQLLEAR